MTLPAHIQKAAEEAAEKFSNDGDDIISHGAGVQWFYDFLLKDAPELPDVNIFLRKYMSMFGVEPTYCKVSEWQHQQSSAQISALKLELAEKDKRIAELEKCTHSESFVEIGESIRLTEEPRKFLTYPLVLDWLQWNEFLEKLGAIDYPQVALNLIGEYRMEIKRLEAIIKEKEQPIICGHSGVELK